MRGRRNAWKHREETEPTKNEVITLKEWKEWKES